MLISIFTIQEFPTVEMKLKIIFNLVYVQDPTYAPVTSQFSSSMTLSEMLKQGGGGSRGLNDSLGPSYYPQFPINDFIDPLQATPNKVLPSPMAPLQPPWPHLPPLDVKKNGSEGRSGGLGGGLANTFNSTTFSSFLASQVNQLINRF